MASIFAKADFIHMSAATDLKSINPFAHFPAVITENIC